jgi:uncharacterized protein DUF3489
MIKTKSKPKSSSRSRSVKASKRKSSTRPVPTAAAGKTRAGTKNALVVAMLQDRAGTTIEAIMGVTGWQEHSVRGFLAGVVRKKLGLNLVSEAAVDGRVYRIIGAPADQVKQTV